MKRTRSLALVIVAAGLVVLLGACGAPPTPTAAPPEEPTAAPGGTAADRKVASIIFTQEPASLNPAYSSMWFEAILQQVWSCWAWEFDDQAAAFPRLVTEVPSLENGLISADGRVITMVLRDDIVWSDGTPITPDDFVFTYEMYMDPGNAVATQYPYDQLESITAPDAKTVVMTFGEPFAPWQSLMWRGVMPKHILGPVFETEGSIDEADWNRAPSVGCGPFVIEEWESGSFMRFVANENYWLGRPKLDEVFVQFVPDDASQTAALIAGDADLGTFPPLSDVPDLRGAGLNIMVQANGYNEGWFFNFRDMASPAIQDVRVRQAIAMALDREAFARDLLLGLAKVAEVYWDALPAYRSPDIEPWPYEPERSRQLLEDAGWTDSDGDGIRENAEGEDLVIVHGTTTREIRQDLQAVAQQQLREVGIDLQILNYDSDLYFGSFSDGAPCPLGENDIMEWSDGPYFPDPDTDYWLCSQLADDDNPWGYNYFGCDETLDELFQRQLTTVDVAERVQIIYEIQALMHDQVYWLGLYEDPDYWIVNPRLTGVKFSGVTPFYNIGDWDLEPQT